MSIKFFKRSVLLCAVGLVVTCTVQAQLPSGTLFGEVTDAGGNAVPGSLVTATNEENISRTFTTGSDGKYRLPALPVGTYRLRVTHEGFRTELLQNVALTVGLEATHNVTLQVGAVSDTVTVSSEPETLNISSASQGSLVGEQAVEDLPLNGRNFEDLTLLQPGIVQQTNTNTVSGIIYSSNGAPTRSNNFLLDGTIMQNAWGYGPASASGTTLGLDGIKEYQIITSLFGAEYGLSMGSQTTIVSKGGSNAFHGDAFYFVRNSALDAANYFDYLHLLPSSLPGGGNRISAFSRNQFGGAFGGPIQKDKTFFFANYEHFQENLGNPLYNGVDTVPSAGCHVAAGVKVDPSVCPEVLEGPPPGIMSATGATLLALLPVPNVPGTNQFFFATNQHTAEDFGQIRLDRNLGPKDTAFVRYTIDNTNQTRPRSLPQFSDLFYSRNQYLTASESHVFSSSFLNTARASLSRTVIARANVSTVPNTSPASFVQNQGIGSFILGDQNANPFYGNFVDPNNKTQDIFSGSDDVFITRGKHSLKLGALYNNYRLLQGDNTVGAGFAVFANTAFLIQGTPVFVQANQQQDIPVPGTPSHDLQRFYTFNTVGLYVQDDFRASQKITVNLGLRYEFATVPSSGSHDVAYRNLATATGGLAVGSPYAAYTGFTQGSIMQNSTLKNFSPRLGFAWDVFGNGKTAVRGGGGIYYDVANIGGALQEDQSGTPPYANIQTVQYAEFGGNAPNFTLPVDFHYATGTAISIDYYAKHPYLGQYNLSVDQQLPYGVLLNTSFVATRGIHLFALRDANPVVPSGYDSRGAPQWIAANPGLCPNGVPKGPLTSCRQNPHLGTFAYVDTTSDSWYDGLQVDLKKNIARKLLVQVAYTFSKALDTTQGIIASAADGSNVPSNPYNTRFDKGPTSFDARHNFRVNSVYYFPNVHNEGFAGKLANGWFTGNIISVQSGYPFAPLVGFNQSNSELGLGSQGVSLGNDRPSYVTASNLAAAKMIDPQATVYDPKAVRVGRPNEFYNPHMFTLPQYGTLGDVRRGSIEGPGIVDWDLSLNKDTKFGLLGEAGRIEFRAETFNVLNHANFVFPGITTNSANFQSTSLGNGVINPQAGVVTSTQINSRQLQFSLRADF